MKGVPARSIRRQADRDAAKQQGVPFKTLFTPLAGSRAPFKRVRELTAALDKATTDVERGALLLQYTRERPPVSRMRRMQRVVGSRAMQDRSKYNPATLKRTAQRKRLLGRIHDYLVGGA